jgi:ADP-ribose pyrophosphatase
MVTDAERLSSEKAFKGKVFSVDRDRVKMPNGRTVMVDVVRHAKSVVLVPVPEPGHVILIRQYRYAVNKFLWELPAGSVDEGESPEEAAKRECHEEIGLVPSTIVRLSAMYPTPGYCDEEMIFFRAIGLRAPAPDSPHKPDADEDITAQTVTLADARAMVKRGEIVDLKTAYALTLIAPVA